ncbi:hypothetical protein SOP93_17560 [Peribacillus frigoritolerans]|uniref:hypothetical protein n=1 Tax=Peribacillus frigoritolerans TaxID=450367 RepID=UPI002B243478|nr:hypothetical protein [Peribacillus frigoritolerans]MEB2492966.1 hypothetical protein [Peribacillus frigoritolerans]
MKKKKQSLAVLLSAGVIATSISLPVSSYTDTSFSTKTEDAVFRYDDENKDKYKLGTKSVQESFTVKKQEVNQRFLSPQLGNHDYFIEVGRRNPKA